MNPRPFAVRFENLPATLPIFPLANAVLLPCRLLPLNIFEPRYLDMVQDALRADRHIGMVQPQAGEAAGAPAPVYRIGCAGRITSFQESEDGRFVIVLTGVCRFEILEELSERKGYRRVRPGWRAYRADLENETEPPVSLEQLEGTLKSYLRLNDLQVDWDVLRQLPPALLVDFLSANLPLDSAEKQALIEAPSVGERAAVLRSALEMAGGGSGTIGSTRH